jgi:hypothetical protein
VNESKLSMTRSTALNLIDPRLGGVKGAGRVVAPCNMASHFQLLGKDPATGARRGRLATLHGTVETPVFMPVGTQGTVKARDARPPSRDRRADHPREHVPPQPQAREASSSATSGACTRSWAGTGPSSRTAAASRSSASRSCGRSATTGSPSSPTSTERSSSWARGGHGHPGQPGLRHRNGARRVPALAGRQGRLRPGLRAGACAGRNAAGRSRPRAGSSRRATTSSRSRRARPTTT